MPPVHLETPLTDILKKVKRTWKERDGVPMVDYSSQKKGSKTGQHAESIDIRDFKKFVQSIQGYDCDIMLEIKDKEKSALKAVKVVS